MEPKDYDSGITYSYLALRKAIGWMGILLPFTLMLGVSLIFKASIIQNSISRYYYTGMRDVLVGTLCSIALFLFYYKGYDKWDKWTANVAGFFSVCIAWFPTTESGPLEIIGLIHILSATIFFLTLAGISIFLFTKKGPYPTKQKLSRNIIYRICGFTIIGCLIAMLVYLSRTKDTNPGSGFLFWSETIALVAFGISWLTKGGTFYPDDKD